MAWSMHHNTEGTAGACGAVMDSPASKQLKSWHSCVARALATDEDAGEDPDEDPGEDPRTPARTPAQVLPVTQIYAAFRSTRPS